MKKLLSMIVLIALLMISVPKALAAGGIYASGGKTITVGQSVTISVVASGATFDTVKGTISVSGPVSISSFSPGSATWIVAPANGATFTGAYLGEKKTSATIATIKLKATDVGTGAVNVSGVALQNAGVVVGSGAGSTSFTINRALSPPAAPTVASSSHPDQNVAYEATDVVLSWNKENGVTGFSYAFDHDPTTIPAQKAINAETTITYTKQAVGVYYFHIRAQNGDGWGGTTHFKVTIKEPDAKIDETLGKPSDISIKKATSFENNITDGTVTGIIISGKTEPDYIANISLKPELTLPEGKTLTAATNESGNFELNLDYPIPAGRYSLIIQGQKEKVLTPLSDPIIFEISQYNGGAIHILTDKDAREAVSKTIQKLWYEKINYKIASLILLGLFTVTLGLLIWLIIKGKKQ
jgi:uncharacterized cupredoxin-like copper-binding protein